MSTKSDKEKLAHIIKAKSTFRADQASKTWEQRVQAISRMNAADKLAKASMLKTASRKK